MQVKNSNCKKITKPFKKLGKNSNKLKKFVCFLEGFLYKMEDKLAISRK